jgi:glutamine amidotransferase
VSVAVIKYNAGNSTSVVNALSRLGVEAVMTEDPDAIASADRVILPGVGEASTAMRHLRERQLDRVIRQLTQPFLGICLGMQILCHTTEENQTRGLGVFDADVRRFPAGGKVPHMGWNRVDFDAGVPLFAGLDSGAYAYFVHSYFADPQAGAVVAKTEYIVSFGSALRRDNFWGVQFHPEKSAATGRVILENFLAL